MARKTYHHLTVGERVPLERVQWDENSLDLTILETFSGTVAQVGTSRLKIEVNGETLPFSRQGGQEWGCSLLGWRISPTVAKKKGKE